MSRTEFKGFDEDNDDLQVESYSRLARSRPYSSGHRPTETCYLRGLSSHQFQRLTLRDDLGIDINGRADSNSQITLPPPSSPGVWLMNARNSFRSFRRLSAKEFGSSESDSDTSDCDEEYTSVCNDGISGKTGTASSGGKFASYSMDGRNDADLNNVCVDDDVSLHGSLSTLSSLEESDFTRLTPDEKRRRDIKSSKKEERRTASKKERAKDEENYKNIIAFATQQFGRKVDRDTDTWRQQDCGVPKSGDDSMPAMSRPSSPSPSNQRQSRLSSKQQQHDHPERERQNPPTLISNSSPDFLDNYLSPRDHLRSNQSRNYRFPSPESRSRECLTSEHNDNPFAATAESQNFNQVLTTNLNENLLATPESRTRQSSTPVFQNDRFSSFATENGRSRSAFLHSSSPSSPNTPLSDLPGGQSPPQDHRAVDSDAEVLRINSEFMKSFAPPDLTFGSLPESASPRSCVDDQIVNATRSGHIDPNSLGHDEERSVLSPMALFRASFESDDPYRMSASASVPLPSLTVEENRSPPENIPQRPNQSCLPRSFEKKRAMLTRPDQEGVFEGDFLRQFPRRSRSESNRLPTGNTVKIEFLPKCLNLVQLKDILDFTGLNAIVKIKLTKEDSTTTAHVKFRDEGTAINVISFLDGCVLRTTDQPLSCSLT